MVKSDFFEEDYVGKITEINNKPDKFFKSASRYIASTSDNKYKNYKEKLLRFIDLLKYSDVYIDDDGNLKNRSYYLDDRNLKKGTFDDLLDYLMVLYPNTDIYRKIVKFKKDIRTILQIKEMLVPQECGNKNSYYQRIQKTNFVLRKQINNSLKFRHVFDVNEVYIDNVSFYLRQIKLKQKNSLNFDVYNLSKMIKPEIQDLDKVHQLHEIVIGWKYSEENFSTISSSNIIIDNVNEYSRARVILRTINEKRRASYYTQSSLEEYLNLKAQGLSKEFFINSNNIEVFKNKLIYNMSIKDWIKCISLFQASGQEFLSKYKDKVIAKVKDLVNYSRKIYNLSYDERQELDKQLYKCAQRFTFHNDLLDTPFIEENGELYTYLPALIKCDLIHMMHVLIKYNSKNGIWQTRGTNFEDKITNILEKNDVICCHTENGIPVSYGGSDEFDILVKDNKNTVVYIECKTFMDPFNVKDQRIELDKIISSKYAQHSAEHRDSLKINYRNLINDVQNKKSKLSKNKSVVNFIKENNLDWKNVYTIFVSNLIVPTKMCKKIFDKYKVYFLYWKELEDLIERNKPFTQREVCKINDLHPFINKILDNYSDDIRTSSFNIEVQCGKIKYNYFS